MTILGSYECCGASNANLGGHYAWCRNSPEKRAAVREESDSVNQPDHYRLGGVEVIDAICAWGFGEGFNRGNAIKYIARAGRKDPAKTVEDLRKAARYLEMEIRRLIGEPMTQDDAAAARVATVATAGCDIEEGQVVYVDEQATETIARLRQELNAESKRRATAERELAGAKP